MIVVGCILSIIIGLFCGVLLAAGSTGFWLWFFALGSEIITLFFVSAFSENIDSDSKSSKVINLIGASFWGIGISLLFSDGDSGMGLALFCVACLFIAPYLIVASLDALFGDSVGAMFAIGIAKLASSILLYTADLESFTFENASAKISVEFFAYIAIISLLALLFWIITISKKISATNEKRHEQKIREEEQRKLSCSKKLIFDAGKNDRDVVLNLLEQGADVNYEDSDGQTPLSNAVLNGNADIASLLLEKGADIDVLYEGKPLLFCAIEKDDKSLVEVLIENGADIEYEDKNEYTPLFYATCNDKIDMVSLLLEKGANIEYKGKYESTPLFVATCNGNLALVSLLLEKGADIECENEDGLTPLFAAATNGYLDIVSLLLEKGADFEHEGRNGMTPLEYAVRKKDKEIISLLLERGADIEHASEMGFTPLIHAISGGNQEVVSFLLENGANIEHETENEVTPLIHAVSEKNKEVVSLLLKKGANIEHETKKFTPLTFAISDKNFETSDKSKEIVSLLIEKGADINRESLHNGQTPLTLAIGQNKKDAVLLLLKNGADPNKRLKDNSSPLAIAFSAGTVSNMKISRNGSPLLTDFSGNYREICSLLMENGANSDEVFCVAAGMANTEIAQFFLDKGADVNCANMNGSTPLMCAIPFSNKEMVLFLISHGADVNFEMSKPSKKNAARTPLEAAIVTGNAEMVSLLITYGADVNYKTKNGNTPLLFAALHQKTELVPLLKQAGAVASVSGKDRQNLAATSHVGSDLQDDSSDFNAALVALSKIIAKNGVEILSAENSQKLKALVSDLIPLGNETAKTLKQALPCGFTQIIQDANGGSDSKKETACKESVGKIVAKTGLMKAAAVAVVKLLALSVGWNLEDFALS